MWRSVTVPAAVLSLAACTTPAAPGPAAVVSPAPPAYTIGAVKAALLTPQQIGAGWRARTAPTDVTELPALCIDGAGVAAPAGEPAAATTTSDWGGELPQSVIQYVFLPPSAAGTTADLRATAEACPAAQSFDREPTAEGRYRPAYEQTMTVADLTVGGWTGFQVRHHQEYEPEHTGSGDHVIAVLHRHNALLVLRYAIFRYGEVTPATEFSRTWTSILDKAVTALA
ncbi:hypothetical protein [Actinoplanes sp. G11-F43]|uniref:hypothetical protein n=1 Tax=Actinoplanes sp. G11-F43 TaxID=3424130 RepID=UPI003D329D2C